MTRLRLPQWLFPVAVAVTGVVLRLPALRISILNEDEALYATAAAAMQEGMAPYHAGVESKPPGIFYLYRAGFDLVGRYQMKALHALTIPWVLVTGGLLAWAVMRSAGRRAGLLAALFYFVFTTVQEPAVLASQCELLYSLPLAGAAFLLLLAAEGERARVPQLGAALLAGLLCALASLIKPTALSLLAAATLWLILLRPLLLGRQRLAQGVALCAALAAGFAGIWLSAATYFRHLGVWDDLVYWAFRWTTQTYLPTGFVTFSWFSRFFQVVGLWALACVALLAMAARAVFVAVRRRAGAETVSFFSAWSLIAFAMVLLGGRFFDHYFPALITPLAGLAGIGAASLQAEGCRTARRLVAAGTALPALLCFVAALHFPTAMRLLGDTRLPYDDVARYVKGHTRPTDRVFVWGYYPLIYVAADRLAATRFVGCHYLTGYAAIGLGRSLPAQIEDRLALPNGFELLVRDLEERRAELLVDTAPANLHHWKRYPIERYPVLAGYVADHFEREAVIGGNVIYRRKR